MISFVTNTLCGFLVALTDAVPAVVVDLVAADLYVVAVVVRIEPVAVVVVHSILRPFPPVVPPRVVPEPLRGSQREGSVMGLSLIHI